MKRCVRPSASRVPSSRCLSIALLSLLALAPLAQAQTNRPSGTVVSWGAEFLPYVATGPRFTAIAAGLAHTLALKGDGSVVAWGANDSCQTTVTAAARSGVVAIAAGLIHSIVLNSDGSVINWSYNELGLLTQPAGIPPAFAIAAGNGFTLALVRDLPPSPTLLRNADLTLSLSWSGAGVLEQTANLTSPDWQPAPNQANPQIISTAGAMKFFRVKAG